MEAELTRRIGEAGKKLHTGRSRNDQVAVDMKLYTRDEVRQMNSLIKEMLHTLLSIMEKIRKLLCRDFTPSAESTADYAGSSYGSIF